MDQLKKGVFFCYFRSMEKNALAIQVDELRDTLCQVIFYEILYKTIIFIKHDYDLTSISSSF